VLLERIGLDARLPDRCEAGRKQRQGDNAADRNLNAGPSQSPELHHAAALMTTVQTPPNGILITHLANPAVRKIGSQLSSDAPITPIEVRAAMLKISVASSLFSQAQHSSCRGYRRSASAIRGHFAMSAVPSIRYRAAASLKPRPVHSSRPSADRRGKGKSRFECEAGQFFMSSGMSLPSRPGTSKILVIYVGGE
jgi:hypothetical protein